ncbi:efflux RND transporter periplasmic adaptor subunit [Rhodanobacter sp. C01]|uniref:efflux RND transporter periplasmic adaptor subunit n=1 Tax=Rhodanobacter sp. C01 TaxID=1945856 RepID=UPI000984DB3D|nr:efflux RND transporter periplasmic adaptor subunit [Rhodanobacter sp. C01]OOG49675.1 efflux transporter periplasmic adaptor subunit [Rhodanobacter sp. C01]
MSFRSIQNLSCLSASIVLALSLAACSHGSNEATQEVPAMVADHGRLHVPEKSPLRTRLVIQSVEMRDVPHVVSFPATVEADPARTANVLPALTGKVVELKVGLGDHVSRGQLLAVIDSGDLAQAYADADKARDALDLAKKSLDRAHGVQEAGGNAVKDLEAAQSGYNQALAEFNRAQTRLAAVGGAAGAHAAHAMNVTAPVGGYVTALSVAPGMYVNDATAAMMTIANLDTVWITANVPESEIALVAKGQSVNATLSAYPDQVFHGRVSFVSPLLQPDTRRDMVRAAVANEDGRLKPNMFANASFDIPQPAQVFVPESALLMNNDNTTVFVEVAPWTFERRTVELSYDETAGARVVKGLKAGDRVIVKGGVLLND